jgi:bacterioferritin-associated ferredoxin
VAEGVTTVEDLGRRFEAGTVCGGCLEELRVVVADALATQRDDPVPDVPGSGGN